VKDAPLKKEKLCGWPSFYSKNNEKKIAGKGGRMFKTNTKGLGLNIF